MPYVHGEGEKWREAKRCLLLLYIPHCLIYRISLEKRGVQHLSRTESSFPQFYFPTPHLSPECDNTNLAVVKRVVHLGQLNVESSKCNAGSSGPKRKQETAQIVLMIKFPESVIVCCCGLRVATPQPPTPILLAILSISAPTSRGQGSRQLNSDLLPTQRHV